MGGPGADAFELGCEAQEGCLVADTAEEVDADGQAAAGPLQGYGHGGVAGDVGDDGGEGDEGGAALGGAQVVFPVRPGEGSSSPGAGFAAQSGEEPEGVRACSQASDHSASRERRDQLVSLAAGPAGGGEPAPV